MVDITCLDFQFVRQNHDLSAIKFSGNFGGNAHRGTKSHSMQNFGCPLHSKMIWAGTGLIEGRNSRNCVFIICLFKISAHWWGFRGM